MNLRLTFLSLLALNLPACGDKPQTTEDTDSSSGSSASSGEATDSTIGVSSEPTTGELPPVTTSDGSQTDSATSASSVATSTTDDSAGSATTTVGPDDTTAGTTGAVDPELAQLCGSVCGRFVECEQANDANACAAECTDNFGAADPLCQSAASDLLTCIEGMTCEQIAAFMNDEDPGPCAAQLAAQAEACGGNECIGSIGSNEEGTECSISSECPDEPAVEMNCDAKTCTCTVGGEKTGECPADGVCANIDDLDAKSEACCGF